MINEIPEELRRKIAAGEVIERPLNVVKELVENSIDSGATKLVIELVSDGMKRIVVRDNGSGMDSKDIRKCYLPHTTSKLSEERDLDMVSTLGFRGEALASIASVAKLTIKSRHSSEEQGTELVLSENHLVSDKLVGMAVGTEIIVEDIFHNLPVRKKQLRDSSGELYGIYRLIDSYSVYYHDTKFVVVSDSRIVKEYLSTGLRERIAEVWGNGIAENLVACEATVEDYSIISLFSRPGFTSKASSHQLVFINGRLVRSTELETFIKRLYKGMLFLETNPMFVLFIRIPYDHVDVNVHPNKRSVKFLFPEKVNSLVESAFAKLKQDKGSTIGVFPDSKPTMRKGISHVDENQREQGTLDVRIEEIGKTAQQESRGRGSGSVGTFLPSLRVIGQLNRTYILAEDKNGMVLIDQHAAEERVFYEQLMKNFNPKSIELVKPLVLELNATQREWLRTNHEGLKGFGIVVEEISRDVFALRALPEFLVYSEQLINELIDELGSIDLGSHEHNIQDMIATFACKKAIKANQELTVPQMKDLLQRLMACEKPFTCPHGRPVVVRYSWGDVEKMFRRKA